MHSLRPTARFASAAIVAGFALALPACKRQKPPTATKVWLGPSGGCAAIPVHPTIGTFACWGANDHGQIGDGTTTARLSATAMKFPDGDPVDLALGARHGCGVFGNHTVSCWGDDSEGQVGGDKPSPSARPTPVKQLPAGEKDLEVRVGGAHTCVRAGLRFGCFGSNTDGQLCPAGSCGTGGIFSSSWSLGVPIRAFALGAAHTCVAYAAGEGGATREKVVCLGRGFPEPVTPLLEGSDVKSLVAGDDHTCALMGDRTVRCWGKNDAGQLGDGTTTDAKAPVVVAGLDGVAELAAGSRHTCARSGSHLVVCWGDGSHHQMANGTTANATHPAALHLLAVQDLLAAGDGACARLDGGYVRCWGRNDRGQLGDGSTIDHDVPMPPIFR